MFTWLIPAKPKMLAVRRPMATIGMMNFMHLVLYPQRVYKVNMQVINTIFASLHISPSL